MTKFVPSNPFTEHGCKLSNFWLLLSYTEQSIQQSILVGRGLISGAQMHPFFTFMHKKGTYLPNLYMVCIFLLTYSHHRRCNIGPQIACS